MELKNIIKIDRKSSIPVATQVLNQMLVLVQQGYFVGERGILPNDTTFAKELGITPTAACKVYHGLRNYGRYVGDAFVLSMKEYQMRQLRKIIPEAIKSGVTLEEIVDIYTNSCN